MCIIYSAGNLWTYTGAAQFCRTKQQQIEFWTSDCVKRERFRQNPPRLIFLAIVRLKRWPASVQVDRVRSEAKIWKCINKQGHCSELRIKRWSKSKNIVTSIGAGRWFLGKQAKKQFAGFPAGLPKLEEEKSKTIDFFLQVTIKFLFLRFSDQIQLPIKDWRGRDSKITVSAAY